MLLNQFYFKVKAIYSERSLVLKGSQLKDQVLKYGYKTMDEIVEAYINLDLLESSTSDFKNKMLSQSSQNSICFILI